MFIKNNYYTHILSFSSHRIKIEHTNGALKGTFQSLKELRTKIRSPITIEQACKWVRACIIIYNILLPLHNYTPADEIENNNNNNLNIDDDEGDEEEEIGAREKRMGLCEWVIGQL